MQQDCFFRWCHQHIFKHSSVTNRKKHLSPRRRTGAVEKRAKRGNRGPETNERSPRERGHGKNGGYCWTEITLAEYKMSSGGGEGGATSATCYSDGF